MALAELQRALMSLVAIAVETKCSWQVQPYYRAGSRGKANKYSTFSSVGSCERG